MTTAWHVHPAAPQMALVDVAADALFKLHEPDPSWRNEADCGEAVYRRPADNSSLPLNCAGAARCGLCQGGLWGAV